MARRLFMAGFSTGWIAPLWLSGRSFHQYLTLEMLPRLEGRQPLNSFPFAQFSLEAFTFALVWLAIVVFCWSWRASANNRT